MSGEFPLPEGYRFEADPAAWDRESMHAFLDTSYWSANVTRDVRERGFDNSLGVAVLHGERQVGFARAITDFGRFAYVADVYVEPDHTRRGIARAMVEWLHHHPSMASVTRWLLITRDAGPVYAGLGYGEPEDAALFMQRRVAP